MNISYQSHLENVGWTNAVIDGAQSGTTGLGLRLEALKISLLNIGSLDIGVTYQAHVQDDGWQDPVQNGAIAGTVGQSKRLEAIRIYLTGADASKYDVLYRVHVENYGWQVWYKNGQTAGTEGCALRAEAIEIQLIPIQEAVDPSIPFTPIIKSIPTENCLVAAYSTHIENSGWGRTVYGGTMSGTVGKSLRVEAIKINLYNKGNLDLGIEYEAHVQDIGWQGAVQNGAVAGTEGQSLRLEAIRIRLIGTDAPKYAVQYRVHVENEGWQDYYKDWQIAGTTGEALRAEAIEIVIVPAGTSLIREPGQTGGVSTEYCTHIQDLSWTGWVKNGQKSGTTGRSLRMEAFKLRLVTAESLNIGVTYRSHVENVGWQDWVVDGAVSGTEGQSLRLEAVEIKLTGTDADDYTIQYRVHVQDEGWTTWFTDGQTAGTTGQALRAEAISIVILKKSDANVDITNEIKNKVPYVQVWGQDYPYPAYLLHDIRTDYRLASSPEKVDSANTIQSLKFDISPDHPHYEDLHNLRTTIQVYEIDSNKVSRQTFEGRVLSSESNFERIKTVTCEGELSYTLDSTQRPITYINTTVDEFMSNVLAIHNASVSADKKVFMGICTVVNTADDAKREYKDYKKTYEVLKDMVDSLGGFLVIRHVGGLRFLDYLDNFRVVNTQPIEFGKNLLDVKKTEYSDGIMTALIPYGDEVGEDNNKQKLTITSVNDGCDFIYDESAVNLYGWIFGTMEFKGTTDPGQLLLKATNALHIITNSVGISIEVTALDLNQINTDIQRIEVGDSVRVVSKPHNIDTFLPVSKITRSLQEANEGTITLGGLVPSMTDYVSGTATYSYFGSNAPNSVKNLEYVTSELMFQIKLTDKKTDDTKTQLDSAELKITPQAITSTVRSSIEYTADLNNKANTTYLSTVNTNLETLTSRVNTAEQKITSDAIVSTVTSSSTYTNALNGKVSTTNIISSINQTAESITINASKINLTGVCTFSNDTVSSMVSNAQTNAQNGAVSTVKTGLNQSGYTTINGGNISGGSLNFSSFTCTGYIQLQSSSTNAGMAFQHTPSGRYGGVYANASKGANLTSGSGGILLDSQDGSNITMNANTIVNGNFSAQNHITTGMEGGVFQNAYKIQNLNFKGSSPDEYVEVVNAYGSAFGVDTWSSDRKLKMNIRPSTVDALCRILGISVRAFNWIADYSENDCGFIAQEIEQALGGSFVLKIKQPDGSERYQLRESAFIPLLTKAIQELADKSCKLENELAIVKLQLADIKGV